MNHITALNFISCLVQSGDLNSIASHLIGDDAGGTVKDKRFNRLSVSVYSLDRVKVDSGLAVVDIQGQNVFVELRRVEGRRNIVENVDMVEKLSLIFVMSASTEPFLLTVTT